MSLVNTAMEVNEKAWKQQFSGVEVSEEVMKTLEKDMVFSYVYLHSKDETNATGVIHIHIIYDTIDEDGNIKPVFAGYFEKEICVPFEEGSIDNPLVCHSVAKYLSSEYLKKPALWSNCSINMLWLALGRKFAGSNQQSEGLTKKVKSKKDVFADAQEPASWAIARWHEQRRGGKTFVKEHERAGHMVSAQMDKVALKLNGAEIATKDALENIKLNTTDMIWDTGKSGLKNESKLRAQMNDIFSMLMHADETNKKKFRMLEEHVNTAGVGTLKGMQYSTFNDRTKGK